MKKAILNTYQSIEEFKVEICDCIYTRYEKSIEEKNRFTLVLSGGNTPRGIYEYLGDNYLNRINWSKVYFFWLDERCTAPENLDSNYFMAHSHLLSKLDHVGGIYRIRGELDKERATRLYLKELNSFFGTEEICFDLILLGMGTDGHIASIFPGLEHSEKTKEIVFYTNKEYNGYYRISLGLDVINACKYNLLMLKGREKIEIFKNGNESHLLPKDLVNFSKIICIDDE